MTGSKLRFVLLIPLALRAQNAQISGIVMDSSEAVVRKANITIVNQETGLRRVTSSSFDGTYLIAAVPPGLYKITVRKERFQTLTRFGIRLNTAESARIDFTLKIGDMAESVTVQDGPTLANSQDSSVSTVIGRQLIDELPLSGRGFLSLLTLAPGVIVTPVGDGETGQFISNGQRDDANYFTVDGVSANMGVSGQAMPGQAAGGAIPATTSFGSFQTLASLESIEEFRVQTSSFAPEFGRTPGAQVAIVTRAGANHFHGSLFHYLRNEGMDANDWFANSAGLPRAPLRVNDFGGVFGGPVRRDRTFFFLSYEAARLRQPLTATVPVPSLATRQSASPILAPVLNAFPLPNGADLGGGQALLTMSAASPANLDAFSGRFDHAFSDRLNAFVRFSGTPSSNDSGLIQQMSSRYRLSSLTAALTAIRSPSSFNDLRLNLSAARVTTNWQITGRGGAIPVDLSTILPFIGPPGQASYILTIADTGQLITGKGIDSRQGQLNLMDTYSLTRGAHQVKFGADYRRLTPLPGGPRASVNAYFDTLEDFLAAQIDFVAFGSAEPVTSLVQNLSLFAQDTWRAGSRLTLTYGLRWELNPPPTGSSSLPLYTVQSVNNPSTIQIAPAGTPLWRTRYSNFAPRLGGAYKLTRGGGTVLRAGVGVYYDLGFGVALNALASDPYNVFQTFPGVQYPISPGQVSLPDNSLHPPYFRVYAYAPNFRLPYSLQWNAALEHQLGGNVVSATYVGSAGYRLLRREGLVNPNPDFRSVELSTNTGYSNFNALQLQFRRPMARNAQAIVSYSWSHSIDNVSGDSSLFLGDPAIAAASDRGSSSFDVRQSFTAAFTWGLPRSRSVFLNNWSADGILQGRTGFPIDVTTGVDPTGDGFVGVWRPNLVPDIPVWIDDASVAGGRRLNPAAFGVPTGIEQGTLGRDAISSFGMWQLDFALKRVFAVSPRAKLQFRAEAFNALNHPNFGDPVPYLISPQFGQRVSMLNRYLSSGPPGLASAFQIGGPRSLQLALKLQF